MQLRSSLITVALVAALMGGCNASGSVAVTPSASPSTSTSSAASTAPSASPTDASRKSGLTGG